MNFFKSFWGTCRGPVAFIALRRQHGGRVVLHLLLVVILSCIGIGIGRYNALKYKWKYHEVAVEEEFGTTLSISENGVCPEKDPEHSRMLDLPAAGLMIYAVNGKMPENYTEKELESRNYVLIWMPEALIFAHQYNERGVWSYSCIDRQDEIIALFGVIANREDVDVKTFFRMNSRFVLDLRQTFTPEQLHKAIADMLVVKTEKWQIADKQQINVRDIFSFFCYTMAVINVYGYVVQSLLMIGIGLLLYMLFYRLMLRRTSDERLLPAGEMWKVVVYASFPVLVVANVFPMLQLPFDRWAGNIFFIAWIIYVNFIRRYFEVNHETLKNMEQ